MTPPFGEWNPTRFERQIRHVESSTGVAHVFTDAGRAYLKALGNREGPHALVRELLGTLLARWLGLPTFDFSLITIQTGDRVKLGHGRQALPGTAFVTRELQGQSWSGQGRSLANLTNPEAITLLVVLDTWILNPDRFPPEGSSRRPNLDNVFMAHVRGKQTKLIAMDFTHCLLGETDLSVKVGSIRHIKDERLFGMFPAFRPFLNRIVFEGALRKLQQVDEKGMRRIVNMVPNDWDVSEGTRGALETLLVQRAAFLTTHLNDSLGPQIAGEQLDMPHV